MKVNNKFLVGLFIFIILVSFIYVYSQNYVDEQFTYAEEQAITAHLLTMPNDLIPKLSEAHSYAYRHPSHMDVKGLPSSVSTLVKPVTSNEMLNVSSLNSSSVCKPPANNLQAHPFEKEQDPALKQIIKANEQLLDANEKLLLLTGKYRQENQGNVMSFPSTAAFDRAMSNSTSGLHVVSDSDNLSSYSPASTTNTAQNSSETKSIQPAAQETTILKDINSYETQMILVPWLQCLQQHHTPDFCDNQFGTNYTNSFGSKIPFNNTDKYLASCSIDKECTNGRKCVTKSGYDGKVCA